jgi:outer membrane protein assembly factor BamB
VGEPHEGAALLKTMPAGGFAPPVRRPPPGAPAPPPSPFAPNIQYVAALTGDGKLHKLWVSNGNEPNTPVQFVPPGADARGLIIFDNTAYVGVTNNCGGSGNGVWALDVASGKVTTWKTPSNLGGSAGPAAGPDGTLYVAAGSELTALAPRTLQPLATYKTAGAQFTSSPVVFEHRFRNLIAAATGDGRLHLLDASKLDGAPLAISEPFSAPGFDSGSLTSWQDRLGNRWILAAAGGPHGDIKTGAIVAFKVADNDGKMAFQRGWTSRDMVAPLPPIVVNGVVFAVSSGEFRSKDAKVTVAERTRRSTPAVLYALDSNTGSVLWNSGSTMTSFVHSGGLAAGGSKVYVSTHDGTQYAFGYDIEH